jgi:hypothetical protein
MSGYDPKTNIFALTGTKISSWLRRDKLPEGMHYDEQSCDGIEIQLFRHFEIDVIYDGGNYMIVRGTPEKIWEALSGQKSSLDNAQHYYTNAVDNSRYVDQHYIPRMNNCRFEKYEGCATKKELCAELGITSYKFDKRRREENIQPIGYKDVGRGVAYFYDKSYWLS